MDFSKYKRKFSSFSSQIYLELCNSKSSTRLAVYLIYIGLWVALTTLVFYELAFSLFNINQVWNLQPLIGISYLGWAVFFINYIYIVISYTIFFYSVVKEVTLKKG